MIALDSPNPPSRKSPKLRPLTPFLPFLIIAASFILECSPLYSPLRTLNLLYLLFLIACRGSVSHVVLASVVILVYLPMIKQRQTEKSVAVPQNLSALLTN